MTSKKELKQFQKDIDARRSRVKRKQEKDNRVSLQSIESVAANLWRLYEQQKIANILAAYDTVLIDGLYSLEEIAMLERYIKVNVLDHAIWEQKWYESNEDKKYKDLPNWTQDSVTKKWTYKDDK